MLNRNLRMPNTRPVLLGGAILAALASAIGASAGTVSLERLPLSVDSGCPIQLLRGTERSKNTAYVLPSVWVTHTRSHNNVFYVRKSFKSRDQYLLRTSLYFPLFNDGINNRRAQTELYLGDANCSPSKLLRAAQAVDPEITVIAPLPINRVKVWLDGVVPKEQAAVIGADASDFSVQGRDFPVEFLLTQDQMQEVRGRVKSSPGLQIQVSFEFNARALESFTSVTFDAKSVAKQLDIIAKGTPHPVLKADLRAKLDQAINQSSMSVYSEGQESELAAKIIDSLISANPPEAVITPSEADANAGGEGDAKFNLKAVAQYVARMSSKKFQVSKGGSETVYSFPASTQVYGDLEPVKFIPVRIKSGPNQTLFTNLNKGQAVTVVADQQWIAPIDYQARRSYYLKSDIIANIETLRKKMPSALGPSTGYLADARIGPRSQWYAWMWNGNWYDYSSDGRAFRKFGATRIVPVELPPSKAPGSKVVPREFKFSSEQTVRDLGIEVRFSSYPGTYFPFESLLKDSPDGLWKAGKFSASLGQFTFVPQVHLGRMSFRLKYDEPTQPKVLSGFFNELWQNVGNWSWNTKPEDQKHEFLKRYNVYATPVPAPVKRKNVQLRMYTQGETVFVLSPKRAAWPPFGSIGVY